jgi:hypothetical protein
VHDVVERQWDRAVFDLPANRRAPHLARRLVGATLEGWQVESLLDDAQLVTSELVTNAVMHAPAPEGYELQLSRRPRGVRLGLIDGSSTPPMIRLNDDRPGGRGLRIIEALASGWGHEEHDGGKRVWVDLDDPTPSRETGIHPS